tara:strand:+ start:1808 stop:2212 length:405 start_codon:yes stop_codon:yes gene_type:complete
MDMIKSKVDNSLLHIINRKEEITARTNVCPDGEFLQLATMRMPLGMTFKPHKHIYKDGPKEVIAQESWIVIQGKVKVILYDIDDTIIHEDVIFPGDCSITFKGGHNYEIMEDDTIVYEYKTGPYQGIEMDKDFI